jgi:amino acid transporter
MRFSNLFYSSYWFNQPLILRGTSFYIWLGFFLVLTVAGVGVLLYRHYGASSFLQKLLARLGSCFTTLGLVGLFWLWLRQERVLFLGWRFWLLAWLVVAAVWLGKIIYYGVKRLPQIKQEHQSRMMKEKYLN